MSTKEQKQVQKTIDITAGRVNVKPDYKGDGVAVWTNLDKNGDVYLNVKVLGHVIACHKPKQNGL